MNILEKEIEDLIYEGICFQPALMRQKGLPVYHNTTYLRQFNLGSYGVADIIGFNISRKEAGYRSILFNVIEIKKDEINLDTLSQAVRYCRALRRLVGCRLRNTNADFGITLIGKKVDTNGDFVFYEDIFDVVRLFTYEIDFNKGIIFKEQTGFFHGKERLPDVSNILPQIYHNLKDKVGQPRFELPF